MVRSVMICGAGGFLGTSFSQQFIESGINVVLAGHNLKHYPLASSVSVEEGDFLDLCFCRGVVSKHLPSHIIFTASPSSVDASFKNKEHDFQSAVTPLYRLLTAVAEMPAPSKFLLTSSAAVYGEPAQLPVCENDPISPISPYGFHKWHQELILKQFHELHGVPTLSARIFSTFGVGLRRLAVWDIAKRAIQGDYTVFGNKDDSRDYLPISDLARAIQVLCERGSFDGEAINVASGIETRIGTLAQIIHAELGVVGVARSSGERAQGVPSRWCASIEKLQELNFHPAYRMQDVVVETVRWIQSEMGSIICSE